MVKFAIKNFFSVTLHAVISSFAVLHVQYIVKHTGRCCVRCLQKKLRVCGNESMPYIKHGSFFFPSKKYKRQVNKKNSTLLSDIHVRWAINVTLYFETCNAV